MAVDPNISLGFEYGRVNPVAEGYQRGLSLRDAARQTQMREMEYADKVQQRESDRTAKAQYGEALAGVLPPELQELARVNPDGAKQIWQFKQSAAKEQIEAVATQQKTLANAAASLRERPYQARRQALAQMAPQLQQLGVSPEMLQGFDPTDAAIDGIVGQAVGLVKVLEFQDKAKGREIQMRGQDITVRGQDLGAASAAAGRAVTVRGQDMSRGNALLSAAGAGGPSGKAPSGYRFKADGSLEAIPGGPADGGKLTEGQSKGVGYYRQAAAAARAMNETKNYDASLVANALNSTDIGYTRLGQAERRVLNAQLAFANGVLRLETGATINDNEIRNKARTLFALPGDGPEVLADKAAQRGEALAALRAVAGPGVKNLPRVIGDNAGPKPGTIDNGYRFNGGDPANPKAWTKVAR